LPSLADQLRNTTPGCRDEVIIKVENGDKNVCPLGGKKEAQIGYSKVHKVHLKGYGFFINYISVFNVFIRTIITGFRDNY
jgi:hypothetical protein